MRLNTTIPTWALWVLLPYTMAQGRPSYTDTPQLDFPKREASWNQRTPAILAIPRIPGHDAHINIDLKSKIRDPKVEEVHTTLVTPTTSKPNTKTRTRPLPPDPFIPGGITKSQLEPHTRLNHTPTIATTDHRKPLDPFIPGGKTISHLEPHSLLHQTPTITTTGRKLPPDPFIPGGRTVTKVQLERCTLLSSTSHTAVPTREPFLPTALPDFLPALPTDKAVITSKPFTRSFEQENKDLRGHERLGEFLAKGKGGKGKRRKVHSVGLLRT
ncbi:hypothetical protein B0J14DRAFT_653047 [Halenospora varia]|nr:hypothetical protein B0J14DRAFT_653047 [Halenospora varia]